MKKITLSRAFVVRATEQGITDIEKWVRLTLVRNFIPVQKISDAMKASTQVGYNIRYNGIEINDPFNTSNCDRFYPIPCWELEDTL